MVPTGTERRYSVQRWRDKVSRPASLYEMRWLIAGAAVLAIGCSVGASLLIKDMLDGTRPHVHRWYIKGN